MIWKKNLLIQLKRVFYKVKPEIMIYVYICVHTDICICIYIYAYMHISLFVFKISQFGFLAPKFETYSNLAGAAGLTLLLTLGGDTWAYIAGSCLSFSQIKYLLIGTSQRCSCKMILLHTLFKLSKF